MYLVLAPNVIHPSHPLPVDIHLLRSPKENGRNPLQVTVKLLRGENQLENIKREVLPLDSIQVNVPVPDQLVGGVHKYTLEVEGEDYMKMDGSVFKHIVPLKIFEPSIIISISMNSAVFCQDQTGARTIKLSI